MAMQVQEIATYAIVGAAVGFLAVRYLRRRATGNCCGEKECPAARDMARKIADHAAGKR
jgi:hypothetical protein